MCAPFYGRAPPTVAVNDLRSITAVVLSLWIMMRSEEMRTKTAAGSSGGTPRPPSAPERLMNHRRSHLWPSVQTVVPLQVVLLDPRVRAAREPPGGFWELRSGLVLFEVLPVTSDLWNSLSAPPSTVARLGVLLTTPFFSTNCKSVREKLTSCEQKMTSCGQVT